MNGADPYAALHQEAAQHNTGSSTPTVSATISAAATPTTATQPTPAPAAAIPAGTASRGSTPGRAGGFPILDKHIKPLVGSDTAKAVRIRLLCSHALPHHSHSAYAVFAVFSIRILNSFARSGVASVIISCSRARGGLMMYEIHTSGIDICAGNLLFILLSGNIYVFMRELIDVKLAWAVCKYKRSHSTNSRKMVPHTYCCRSLGNQLRLRSYLPLSDWA